MTARELAQQVTLLFFKNFFHLLLIAVAVAEWACVAWGLRAAGMPAPAWTHVLVPALLYGVNRSLVRKPEHWRSPLGQVAVRVYSSVAFTAVFGAGFLLLNSIAWGVIAALTHGVSLAAGDANTAVLPSRAYEWTSTAGLLTITLLFAYGYTLGQHRLSITRLRLPLRRAGRGLAGVRIAHITDIHIGRYMAPEVLAEYVARVNALDADIIVVTGDLLDVAPSIERGFPVLAGLRARHGVFVVLGNHDFYAGAAEVTAGLHRLTDFTVLRNQKATVEINGSRLHIAGVDDLGLDWARGVPEHPGFTDLLPQLPADEPVVLLSHRPDMFAQAARAGVGLMLSGHTHGGQLSLPPIGGRAVSLARFITRYDRGLFRDGDSFLYVNRGLGCTGQRIRLFAPREIAIFEIA